MLAGVLVQAQQHHDREATLHILESFTPKIKASLRQVPADHRDDLKQELYVKMIEVIQTFDISELKLNLESSCKKETHFSLFICEGNTALQKTWEWCSVYDSSLLFFY